MEQHSDPVLKPSRVRPQPSKGRPAPSRCRTVAKVVLLVAFLAVAVDLFLLWRHLALPEMWMTSADVHVGDQLSAGVTIALKPLTKLHDVEMHSATCDVDLPYGDGADDKVSNVGTLVITTESDVRVSSSMRDHSDSQSMDVSVRLHSLHGHEVRRVLSLAIQEDAALHDVQLKCEVKGRVLLFGAIPLPRATGRYDTTIGILNGDNENKDADRKRNVFDWIRVSAPELMMERRWEVFAVNATATTIISLRNELPDYVESLTVSVEPVTFRGRVAGSERNTELVEYVVTTSPIHNAQLVGSTDRPGSIPITATLECARILQNDASENVNGQSNVCMLNRPLADMASSLHNQGEATMDVAVLPPGAFIPQLLGPVHDVTLRRDDEVGVLVFGAEAVLEEAVTFNKGAEATHPGNVRSRSKCATIDADGNQVGHSCVMMTSSSFKFMLYVSGDNPDDAVTGALGFSWNDADLEPDRLYMSFNGTSPDGSVTMDMSLEESDTVEQTGKMGLVGRVVDESGQENVYWHGAGGWDTRTGTKADFMFMGRDQNDMITFNTSFEMNTDIKTLSADFVVNEMNVDTSIPDNSPYEFLLTTSGTYDDVNGFELDMTGEILIDSEDAKLTMETHNDIDTVTETGSVWLQLMSMKRDGSEAEGVFIKSQSEWEQTTGFSIDVNGSLSHYPDGPDDLIGSVSADADFDTQANTMEVEVEVHDTDEQQLRLVSNGAFFDEPDHLTMDTLSRFYIPNDGGYQGALKWFVHFVPHNNKNALLWQVWKWLDHFMDDSPTKTPMIVDFDTVVVALDSSDVEQGGMDVNATISTVQGIFVNQSTAVWGTQEWNWIQTEADVVTQDFLSDFLPGGGLISRLGGDGDPINMGVNLVIRSAQEEFSRCGDDEVDVDFHFTNPQSGGYGGYTAQVFDVSEVSTGSSFLHEGITSYYSGDRWFRNRTANTVATTGTRSSCLRPGLYDVSAYVEQEQCSWPDDCMMNPAAFSWSASWRGGSHQGPQGVFVDSNSYCSSYYYYSSCSPVPSPQTPRTSQMNVPAVAPITGLQHYMSPDPPETALTLAMQINVVNLIHIPPLLTLHGDIRAGEDTFLHVDMHSTDTTDQMDVTASLVGFQCGPGEASVKVKIQGIFQPTLVSATFDSTSGSYYGPTPGNNYNIMVQWPSSSTYMKIGDTTLGFWDWDDYGTEIQTDEVCLPLGTHAVLEPCFENIFSDSYVSGGAWKKEQKEVDEGEQKSQAKNHNWSGYPFVPRYSQEFNDFGYQSVVSSGYRPNVASAQTQLDNLMAGVTWSIEGTNIGGPMRAVSDCRATGQSVLVAEGLSDEMPTDTTAVGSADTTAYGELHVDWSGDDMTMHGFAGEVTGALTRANVAAGIPAQNIDKWGNVTTDMQMEDTQSGGSMQGHLLRVVDTRENEVIVSVPMYMDWRDDSQGLAMNMDTQLVLGGDLVAKVNCTGEANKVTDLLSLDLGVYDDEDAAMVTLDVGGTFSTRTGLTWDAYAEAIIDSTTLWANTSVDVNTDVNTITADVVVGLDDDSQQILVDGNYSTATGFALDSTVTLTDIGSLVSSVDVNTQDDKFDLDGAVRDDQQAQQIRAVVAADLNPDQELDTMDLDVSLYDDENSETLRVVSTLGWHWTDDSVQTGVSAQLYTDGDIQLDVASWVVMACDNTCYELGRANDQCSVWEEEPLCLQIGDCARSSGATWSQTPGATYDLPPMVDGQTSAAACEGSYVGQVALSCSAGVSSIVSGDCRAPQSCTAGSYTSGGSNVNFPTMQHGGLLTVACPADYEGELRFACDDGSVSVVTGECQMPSGCSSGFVNSDGWNSPVPHSVMAHDTVASVDCGGGYSGSATVECNDGVVQVVSADACQSLQSCASRLEHINIVVDDQDTDVAGSGTPGYSNYIPPVSIPTLQHGESWETPCDSSMYGEVFAWCDDGLLGVQQHCTAVQGASCSAGSTSGTPGLVYSSMLHGEFVEISCPSGYTGSQIIGCNNGVVNVFDGSCASITCPPGTASSNGDLLSFGGMTHGASTTVPCNSTAGYTGDATFHCQGGVVSQQPGAGCQTRRGCNGGNGESSGVVLPYSAMADQQQATVSCPSTHTGSATFQCNDGTVTMLSSGNTCTPIPGCPAQLASSNGVSLNFTSMAHGQVQTIHCPTAFTGSVVATCTSGSTTLSGACTPRQQTSVNGQVSMPVSAQDFNDPATGLKSNFIATTAQVSGVPVSQITILSATKRQNKNSDSVTVLFRVVVYGDSATEANLAATTLQQTLETQLTNGNFVTILNNKLQAGGSTITIDSSAVTFSVTTTTINVNTPTPTPGTSDDTESSDSTAAIAGGVAGGLVLVVGVSAVICFTRRKKKQSTDDKATDIEL